MIATAPSSPPFSRTGKKSTKKNRSEPMWNRPYRPLLNLPMDCGIDNGPFTFSVDSWNHPRNIHARRFRASRRHERDRLRRPAGSLQTADQSAADRRDAGSPTGPRRAPRSPTAKQTRRKRRRSLFGKRHDARRRHPADEESRRHLPRRNDDLHLGGTGPRRLHAQPSLALGTNKPVTCPDNSQYGHADAAHADPAARIEPMRGFIYIAKKGDNPYNNFLSMYFVIQEPRTRPADQDPGQDRPRPRHRPDQGDLRRPAPVPALRHAAHLQGRRTLGPGQPAHLRLKKIITADFYSWADPNTPTSRHQRLRHHPKAGRLALRRTASANRPFDVQMSAGTVNPNAGSYTPFIFRMQRTDDDQEFSQIGTALPPGLTAQDRRDDRSAPTKPSKRRQTRGGPASWSGDTRPVRPRARSAPPTSDPESASRSPTSRGKLYLAGPYRGAPLSIVVDHPGHARAL